MNEWLKTEVRCLRGRTKGAGSIRCEGEEPMKK